MAKFAFTVDLGKRAVASLVNSMYNELRNFVNNTFATDTVSARTVDHKHLAEPASMVVRDEVADISVAAVGQSVCEVFYAPTLGDYKVVAVGAVWPRRKDGAGVSVAFPVFHIDWYDNTGAVWYNFNLADYGVAAPYTHEAGHGQQAGQDYNIGSPQPGIGGYVIKFGGHKGMIMTRSFRRDQDWPPVGTTATRIGIVKDVAMDANADGQGFLFALIEDNS